MRRTPLIRSTVAEYVGKIPGDMLFLDLESLPTDDPRIVDMLAAKIKPPGNMSKPETIAKWEAEEKPLLIAEAVGKTSFDGSYGRICCACWAFGDQPVDGAVGDERDVIKALFKAISEYTLAKLLASGSAARYMPEDEKRAVHALKLSGHNVRAFDMRFLWKRAVVLGIPIPQSLPWKESQWSERFQDTMTLWDPEKRISLGNLCYILGIDHDEDDFDGSMVADAFKAGRYSKILRYCKADVEAARRCWYRMTIATLF